jgi:DNA-binding transcriptional MocR family regulator
MDLLEQYGLEPVPVGLDEHGMIPREFAAALGAGPTMVVLQPRAQNPTGVSMTRDRAQELATLLHRSRTAEHAVVLEDDHSGAISSAPDVTIASWLPERVLHVRSFSKSHGPDLRIGALGGPRALVDRVVARRLLGPGWTSRMIQAMLYELLTDPESVAQVAAAGERYAQRQRELSAAVQAAGATLRAGDGVNAWLRVADERSAIVQLAAAGIRVAPGAPFQLGEPGGYVRVTVGMVRDDVAAVGAALAAAARA